MSRLTIIVAATKSNGIGQNGQLPWRLPKEMTYFARATSSAPAGHCNAVIMGRNTWESIPNKFRPLKTRENIVVSKNASFDAGLAKLEGSLEAAITRMKANQQIFRGFIIGGASLYAESLALPPSSPVGFVDRVLLTRILSPAFDACDVFMPDFLGSTSDGKEWRREAHSAVEEWLGFKVAEGAQEENGVEYEFQMWSAFPSDDAASLAHGFNGRPYFHAAGKFWGAQGSMKRMLDCSWEREEAGARPQWPARREQRSQHSCSVQRPAGWSPLLRLTMNRNLPRVGARSFLIFACTLVAFVIETQLTQYLQTDLGYRQPFFIFYLVHSSFAIIFPCHLLYLTATTKYSATALCNGLAIALSNHLTPNHVSRSTTAKFPTVRFLTLVLALTFGITWPAILWFIAISWASLSDVTALWNANAFFAYLMTFKCRWEPRKLFAVSLATIGVLIVVYGGSAVPSRDDAPSIERRALASSWKPLMGSLLTLIASVGYALYQVLYKKYAALPSDPELVAEASEYEQLATGEDSQGVQYGTHDATLESDDTVYPPPFGLHPNLLTSAIGLCTLSVLWIFIPLLHHTGAELFLLPPNLKTVSTIVGISLGGVVFNAGFMILLGVWGPIITSVGNLLTIVLVFISDVLFGAGVETITLGSVVGCSIIVAAFAVLVYDMLDR
ncbi:hypothetical protein R3P38DRAFT_2490802 [Favolaschia claudopus]|uniref:dihydrofolate reductase n=1 Tax=Favolaschia claudopus TaxID=2862362 RepID=A0AAW0EI11_9AGAR